MKYFQITEFNIANIYTKKQINSIFFNNRDLLSPNHFSVTKLLSLKNMSTILEKKKMMKEFFLTKLFCTMYSIN